MIKMKNATTWCVLLACMAGCVIDAVDTVETASVAQYGMNMQGMNMQGMNMQGATLGGATLSNVRVDKGELIVDRGGQTLRGTALVGARFTARITNADEPPVIA